MSTDREPWIDVVDDVEDCLLDVSGSWTSRDRQQHHRFAIEVPDLSDELRIRFRWQPLQVGSRHERNLVTLSLFDPAGFRGAAVRARVDQELTISEVGATPGLLAGPIVPGEWSIVLDTHEILNTGAESGRLEYHLEAVAKLAGGPRVPRPIAASPPQTASVRVRPSGAGWYRGDLHSHTVHSDGSTTVDARALGAVERGLDFLAITDHNTISQARTADAWPEALSRIRGSEITTFHGHLNCLGLGESVDWRDAGRGSGAARIIDQASRQGAVLVINHPSAFGNPWCAGCHWDFARVDYSRIDGIEVWNGRWSEPETDNAGALALWTDLLDAGLRLTAVAGTDSHSAEEDQYADLPLTFVRAVDSSEASVLDAIRNGRVFLSSGPLVTFRATWADGTIVDLPGAELQSDGAFDLTVDLENAGVDATLWYVTSGLRTAIGRCDTPSARFVAPALTARAWWRLEVRRGTTAVGDMLALTSPVYVRGSTVP